MSYTTAVTDRTAADVVAKNTKAYFNIADWSRIYRNAELVNSLCEILVEDGPLSFPIVSTPTITIIPSITDFNSLLSSVEVFRTLNSAITAVAPTAIKHDWIAGVGEISPKYTDVNLWESTIDAIWTYLNGTSYAACPTLTTNLTIPTLSFENYINCIDTGTYTIKIQGDSRLFII